MQRFARVPVHAAVVLKCPHAAILLERIRELTVGDLGRGQHVKADAEWLRWSMPWATVDLVQAKVRRLVAEGYVTRTQLYEHGKRGDSLYALTAKGLKVLTIEDMSDYINPGIVTMHDGEIEEVKRKTAGTKVDFLGSEAKSIHTKVDLLASEATHIIERTNNKEKTTTQGVEEPPPSGEVDSFPTPSKEASAATPPQSPSPSAGSGAPAGDRPLAGVPGPAAGSQPSRPIPAERQAGGVEEVHRAYDRGGLTGAARADYARIIASGVPHEQVVTAAKLWASVVDRGMQKHFPRWLEEDLWATKPPARLSLTGNVAVEGNASASARLKQRRARPNPDDLAKIFSSPQGRNQS